MYKHIYEQMLTFLGANVERCDKALFLKSLNFVVWDAFLNIPSKDDNIERSFKSWCFINLPVHVMQTLKLDENRNLLLLSLR